MGALNAFKIQCYFLLLFFWVLEHCKYIPKGTHIGELSPSFFQSQNREYWQSSSELCKIVRKHQSKGVLHLPASCLALPASGTAELSSFIKVPPLSHLEQVLVWIESHFPLSYYEHRLFHHAFLSEILTLLQVTIWENAGSQQIPTNVNNLEAINMRGNSDPAELQGSIMWHCWLMQVTFLHRSPRSEIQS